MEIYVDDTEANIPLTDGPFRPDHVVSVTIDGDPYLPAVVEDGVDSPYINLPYKHVQYGGEREIIWTYVVDEDQFSKRQRVDVVTPILHIATIKSLVKPPAYVAGVDELTDSQAMSLERKVRYAIQTYTGKYFGTFKGQVTGTVRGSKIYWPLDPITIDAYSVPYWPNQKVPYYDPKMDVIIYPNVSRINPEIAWGTASNEVVVGNLPAGNKVTATGLFGYESIPGDVEEAARILLNDYSCNEANYREMYIANVRNADWRFEFRANAWAGTGNAVVDDMLSHYLDNYMVVI